MTHPVRGGFLDLLARLPGGTAGDWRRVGGLRSASVQPTREALPAANPTAYGPRYAVRGQTGWQVSGDGLRLYTEDEAGGGFDVQEGWRILREEAQPEVMVCYPDGSRKSGAAIVRELPDEGQARDVLQGSVSLEGVGALTREAGLWFWADGSSYDGAVWTDKSTFGRHSTGGAAPALNTTDETFPFLEFDGTQYLTLPDGTVPMGNTPYTIAGVVHVDGGANNSIINGSDGIGEYPNEIDIAYFEGNISDGWGNGPPPGTGGASAGPVDGGAWAAFVGVYRAGLQVTMRVAGGGHGGVRYGRAVRRERNSGPIVEVGREHGGLYLTGGIADLRVFGGALSPLLQARLLKRYREAFGV